MNTITFDTEKAKQIEAAVCCEFGTGISDIVSIRDTMAKKVVVFILSQHFKFGNRIIGHKYQMTYLFIPMVILEIENLIKLVPGVGIKIDTILKKYSMRKKWTEKEIGILVRLYPDCKTETLAFILNRKVSIVCQKACSLKISKSEGWKKSSLSGRISKENDIGVETRFQNQRPGWNKGLKQSDYMSSEMIERTAKTRFKKGQDPHNTVAVGHERLSRDGYLEVKLQHKKGVGKNCNFVAKHRILWEKINGPIPENYNVEFVDGNKMNIEISNLVLRSKAENLLKNTMSDRSIVKRFLKVKEPEMVDKIIAEIPGVISQKRESILLNQLINKNNAN